MSTTCLAQVINHKDQIRVLDEEDREISTMCGSGKVVVGVGDDFFVSLEGSWIKTYDERCRHIATMPSIGRVVFVTVGISFTCKESGCLITYDKYCRLLQLN